MYIKDKKKQKSQFQTYSIVVLISSLVSGIITLISASYLYNTSKFFNENIGTELKVSKDKSSITKKDTKDAIPIASEVKDNKSQIDQIIKKISDSTVNINIINTTPFSSYYGQPLADIISVGSGVFIKEDGYILTNFQTVEQISSENSKNKNYFIQVVMQNGDNLVGTYIGGDSRSDIAVVKVENKTDSFVTINDNLDIKVNDEVYSTGCTYQNRQIQNSVKKNNISLLKKSVIANGKLLSLIQTTNELELELNGSILFTKTGEIAGLSTFKYNAPNTKSSFFIPHNLLKTNIAQIIENGYVQEKPFWGFEFQELSDLISERYKLPPGIYINNVIPSSNAQLSGIRKGDIIIEIDSKTINKITELEEVRVNHNIGDTLNFKIYRNKKYADLPFTFKE